MKEIERKYLARVTRPLVGPLDKRLQVRQGYLVVWPWLEWRLRSTNYTIPAKGLRYHTALKVGNGYVRTEYEREIPRWLFGVLQCFVPDFLTKDRVSQNGWEVDTFHGPLEGLVLAEAEVPTPETPVPPLPDGLELLLDVTEARTFANKNLSRLHRAEARALVRRAVG